MPKRRKKSQKITDREYYPVPSIQRDSLGRNPAVETLTAIQWAEPLAAPNRRAVRLVMGMSWLEGISLQDNTRKGLRRLSLKIIYTGGWKAVVF